MSPRTLVRIALGYLAVVTAQIGFWALVAPKSFYDGFPGLGRAWVAVDGPYNEHLVRDIGALNLALLVVLVVAALRMNRETLMLAAGASAAWGGPHLLYHVFNTDGLATVDIALNLGGLATFAAFAAMLFVVARNPAITEAQPA